MPRSSGPSNYFSIQAALTEKEILDLCRTVHDIFRTEPVVVDVQPPVSIFGDVHGQLFDMKRQLDLGTVYVYEVSADS